ncbi:F-box family protein [Carex rostrata]
MPPSPSSDNPSPGSGEASDDSASYDGAPINYLPPDALHNILLRLPLRDAVSCRAVSRTLRDSLSAPSFLSLLPTLRLLLLRHPRPTHGPSSPPSLHAFDPSTRRWLLLPLPFLPSQVTSFSPVSSSTSLLYLWLDPNPPSTKSLAVCNPLSQSYRLLPPLGSAWSRHGTVLAGPRGTLLVISELAVMCFSPLQNESQWMKHALSLPTKPRSPVLINETLFTLCDVGSAWRSQWKLFSCPLAGLGLGFGPRQGGWAPVERHMWGDVFEILKRPRLLPGSGGRRLLMIGGLRSSFAMDAPCSTVLILRLDLERMEWDEAGRMPPEMYRCFTGIGEIRDPLAGPGIVTVGNNKVKVFGGEGRVWFSGKRVRGKIAMWEEYEDGSTGGEWSWVEGIPGYNEGVYRGIVFDAGFTAMP